MSQPAACPAQQGQLQVEEGHGCHDIQLSKVLLGHVMTRF